jgi:hypothetical protein
VYGPPTDARRGIAWKTYTRRTRTVKLAPPYIHQFLVNTDEYKFIFIGFGTDEYNLNIFIDTDEFKNPDE